MENQLTPNESLDIITNAIRQAKMNIEKGGSFQILWWGWIIAIANFGHYILIKTGFEAPYIVWILIIPGVIVSAIKGYQMKKSARVVTFIDTLYGHIWLAAFIVIMTSVIFMSKLNYYHEPVILGVAGMGMYITGMLLRFKPVIIGALILWVGSLIAFNVPVNDQLLVGGISIVLGYLIPGYLLKRAER